MPRAIRSYVRYVDAVNRVVGRFAMYMIFAMMGLLLYPAITKTFFLPAIWTLELAQFSMAAYYLLGGGYSMQPDSHVRMDLVYGLWSSKGKGFTDSLTSFCLGFDLVWYGVLYTITCQIAYMTPPFGYNVFLMRAMAPPEVTLGDIYRSIIPFVLVMCVGLTIVMVFPEIALWLPKLLYGK